MKQIETNGYWDGINCIEVASVIPFNELTIENVSTGKITFTTDETFINPDPNQEPFLIRVTKENVE